MTTAMFYMFRKIHTSTTSHLLSGSSMKGSGLLFSCFIFLYLSYSLNSWLMFFFTLPLWVLLQLHSKGCCDSSYKTKQLHWEISKLLEWVLIFPGRACWKVRVFIKDTNKQLKPILLSPIDFPRFPSSATE